MAKRVAIIGAGAAGLTSVKNALEAGLEPTAYEKSSWLGGLWYYTEENDRYRVAPKSTDFITSKHYSCFSDFPFPKETPNYTPRHVFQQYLESYAEKFDLTKRIRFNTEVLKVEKCQDYEETGRWEIHSKTSSDDNGKENVCIEEYDYVMVCSGFFAKPFVPNIAGMDGFTGRMMHSKSYRTFTPFVGRRVVVVGIGNTAAIIACELSRHAKQVYISTRRGSYIIPRMDGSGVPTDFSCVTRARQFLPTSISNLILHWKLNSIYNLRDLGMEPTDYRSLTYVLVNDELPHRITTGSLIVKDEIIGFRDKKVFFKDGTELDDIDDVIFTTGYDVHLPFLPKSVYDPDKEGCGHQLYKIVFPVDISRPTVAFIGFFRLRGAFKPLLEMQARWAMHVFKGECNLPSKEVMKKEIEERQKRTIGNKNRSSNSELYMLTEGPLAYVDDIASLIGVKPNLWKLFLQDPKLALKCFFGPAVPAQYRLMGPGAWSGAKDVIEEVEESRLAPLTTRKGNNSSGRSSSSLVWIMCSSIVVLLIGIYFSN